MGQRRVDDVATKKGQCVGPEPAAFEAVQGSPGSLLKVNPRNRRDIEGVSLDPPHPRLREEHRVEALGERHGLYRSARFDAKPV